MLSDCGRESPTKVSRTSIRTETCVMKGDLHNRLPLRHGIYDLILVQLSANQKLRCCPLTQFKDMFVGTRFKLIWQGFLLE